MDNNFFREMKLKWAGSRENNLAPGRGGVFFLTSLFIELIDVVAPARNRKESLWIQGRRFFHNPPRPRVTDTMSRFQIKLQKIGVDFT
jgi:hypothetical protein